MQCRMAKLLLGAVFGGLCLSVQANTTEALGGMQTAQNDLSIAPAPSPAADALPTRIALLLPLGSGPLLPAANAVRAGFMEASGRAQDGATVDVIDSGDTPEDILNGYAQAAAQHDIVIGPLSRSGVTALAKANVVNRPTIALTQAEPPAGGELKMPAQMLSIGLSIEDEARQIADWALANRKATRAFVISTPAAWQRRAANAFVQQWQKNGREAQTIELAAGGGYLEAKGLAELKGRLQSDVPALVFTALDAQQARQVRAAIGRELAMYGTSQLNPLSLADWETAERTGNLDGVRFVDMPWQLQADNPAVMAYGRMESSGGETRSADIERLYALGIDAYRVAQSIAANRKTFELDGVTGKLSVHFGNGVPVFTRIEPRAIYLHGAPVVTER
jgi:uncharacterized protein